MKISEEIKIDFLKNAYIIRKMDIEKFIYWEDHIGGNIGLIIETSGPSYDTVKIQIFSTQGGTGMWIREPDHGLCMEVDLRKANNVRFFDDYEEFVAEYFAQLL